MPSVFKGETSQSRFVELVDSTTGLPKTGIVYTDVTGSYTRTRSARTAITMATLAAANSSFSSGGFKEVDGTNAPGLYRVDVPDAAFATGVYEVVVTIKATGCRTVSRTFELEDWNKQIAAIPNAAAGASTGLVINGTNAGTVTLAGLTSGGNTVATTAEVLGTALVARSPGPDTRGLYAFDSNAIDAAGLQNATLVGSPTYGTACGGIPGQSLVLNGSSQYATIAGLLSTPGTIGFSVGLRFRPGITYTAGQTARLVTKFFKTPSSPPFNGLDILFNGDEGKLCASIYTNVTDVTQVFSRTTVWTSGVDYDVVVTYGPGGLALWVNGQIEGWVHPVLGTPVGDNTATPFTIGAYNAGSGTSNYFTGAIDDLWVRSGPALPEEIQAFHAAAVYHSGQGESGRWASVPRRTLLLPSGGSNWDGDAVLEETNTVLLSDGVTRIAAYTGFLNSSGHASIGLVTVTLTNDGEVWTRRGSLPVVGNGHGGESGEANGSWLMKAPGSDRIYLYYTPGYTDHSPIKLAVSDDDGVTWTNLGIVIAHDAQGWCGAYANPAVYIDPVTGVWLMLLAGNAGTYKAALARCPSGDGVTWILDPRNPLTSVSLGGLYALRSFARVAGKWRAWGHYSTNGVNLPSGTARWDSDDLINWSASDPAGPVIFPDATQVPGHGIANQNADPAIEGYDGRVFMRFDVDQDNSGTFYSYIAGMAWPGTLEELVSGTAPQPLGRQLTQASALLNQVRLVDRPVAAIPAAILLTPENKLGTDVSNRVTTSNPANLIQPIQAGNVEPIQS